MLSPAISWRGFLLYTNLREFITNAYQSQEVSASVEWNSPHSTIHHIRVYKCFINRSVRAFKRPASDYSNTKHGLKKLV